MAIYTGHNEDSSGNLLLSIGNGMTATVETSSTASQAYTKGSYVFFDNKLCKTTSAIASGATLAIGTNLSQTSLGAELTSHLRSSDGKEFYFDVKDGTYGYYPSASKTASEFVPFGGTDPEEYVFIDGYGGWINAKTLYMAFVNGTISTNYVTVTTQVASPTVTAKKPCKIKMWRITDAGATSGQGKYSEHTLATGDTVTAQRYITLIMVYPA